MTVAGGCYLDRKMRIPENKKIAVITGTVWTGSRSAPRRMLVKDGFVRPTWFTTSRRINDAAYVRTSITGFRLAKAHGQVIAHMRYGGGILGIMEDSLGQAMEAARRGVLIVGPPEIAAQVAACFEGATVFTLKDPQMSVSPHLEPVARAGQLHRIDVDALAPGAWTAAYATMLRILGLPDGYESRPLTG